MGISLRWVGQSEMDRVAEVRLHCYAHSHKEIARYQDSIRADTRTHGDAFLLAEQDGIDVGTTTSLSLQMWVRGARLACQGIAYVGTIKTHRRGSKGPGGGIATQLMNAALKRARDEQLPATALMPFRASFYEHFGYGTVETRHNWKIPLSVLPTGAFEGMRFYVPEDRSAVEAARQRNVESGQCDIERPSDFWDAILRKTEDGFVVVDRPSMTGPVHGYLWLQHAHDQGQEHLKVIDCSYDDVAALQRQFHFLASLRDQYSVLHYPFPADFQANWLLREVQLPHRPTSHATADVRVINRLQVRVLDHKKFIEPMHLPKAAKGRAAIAVRETEGDVSRFTLDFANGRAEWKPSNASTEFECSDRIWAAIVCGELAATQAVMLGMASCSSPATVASLDIFANGLRPFCREAF